jgi:hypothetical protein
MRLNRTQSRLLRRFPHLEILEQRDLPSVFGPVQTVGTGTAPSAVAAGDFNHDGKLDLAITNSGDATVSILLGNGSGGFTATTPISVGFNPDSVAVGDFNNDGNLDLAVANEGSNTISILLGNGAGATSLFRISPRRRGTGFRRRR